MKKRNCNKCHYWWKTKLKHKYDVHLLFDYKVVDPSRIARGRLIVDTDSFFLKIIDDTVSFEDDNITHISSGSFKTAIKPNVYQPRM